MANPGLQSETRQNKSGNLPPPRPERLEPEDQTQARRNLNTIKGRDRMSQQAKAQNQAGKNIAPGIQSPELSSPGTKQGENKTSPYQSKIKSGEDASVAARGLGQEQRKSALSKIKQARQMAKAKVGQIQEAATQAGNKITAELLKQSWLNLITSWGLTFIYIELHFLAKYFASSRMFCDFGEEWTGGISGPGGMSGAAAGAKGSGASTPANLDAAVPKTGLKFAEIIIFLSINFILIFAVILFLTLYLAPVTIMGGIIGYVFDLL